MTPTPASVNVVGSGSVGRALAACWQRAGMSVLVAVRDPADAKHDAYRQAYALVRLDDSLPDEPTVLAVPGGSLPDLLEQHASLLDGRLLVDTSNVLGNGPLHQLGLLARRVPSARVYRAFSCVGWENVTGLVAGERPDMPYSGPDGDDRATVGALISRTGMRPVWLGDGPAAADVLDGLARAWFTLALGRGLGRELAFKVLSTRELN